MQDSLRGRVLPANAFPLHRASCLISLMAALSPNARADAVAESATLAISARAAEMRASGQDVVSLSAGEPDFPTPPDVAEAGIEAIRTGNTRYTATSGIPDLRRAATEWLSREIGLSYAPNEVMVTAGAKAALHMTLTSIVEPGDRVLLLAPYWVSYPDLVSVAGGEPVIVPPVPDADFVHSGEQLAAAAAEHGARGVIMNYPNNPSGAVPSREQMQQLVEAAAAHDMWIVSDEIYASMRYDGREHASPASFARERTVFIGGATKSHSFTGWRLAFLAGPADVVAAAGRIQSQVIGNPCTISQAAALAICSGDHSAEKSKRMAAFDERRQFLVEHINAIDGLTLRTPHGAFYALVDARPLCDRRGVDDVALAAELLEKELLAVVPGGPFGIPGFIRLSYASSLEALKSGVERLKRFAEAQ